MASSNWEHKKKKHLRKKERKKELMSSSREKEIKEAMKKKENITLNCQYGCCWL